MIKSAIWTCFKFSKPNYNYIFGKSDINHTSRLYKKYNIEPASLDIVKIDFLLQTEKLSRFIIKEFDINSFDYDDSFLFKEVYIRIEFLNDVILSLLSKQFPKFNVKNNNIVYGRANNKSILDLILFLLDMQIFIKDIRIDNKILEDMLLNLS